VAEVPMRRRWPAIPTNIISPNDLVGLSRVLDAMRERLEIFSRDRGRIEDSVVTVQDLLDMRVITPEQLNDLQQRTRR
jgi:hypothetical protein